MKKAILIAVMAGLASVGRAGVPQPCTVVYGLLRDAYGFPYSGNAEVTLSRQGVECDRYRLGASLGSGINYRLELDLDSGGSRYAPYAVQKGDQVDITVTVGGVIQPLMPTNRLAVTAPGATVRIDLCTATDSDGDGLSDQWEQQLIAQSGGRLTSLADVNPEDDFDGDGLSNVDEFRVGTFAFMSTDVLQFEEIREVAPNRMRCRFLTSNNVTYRLMTTSDLRDGQWQTMPFAESAEGSLAYREIIGDGGFCTVYIDVDRSDLFVRIAVR